MNKKSNAMIYIILSLLTISVIGGVVGLMAVKMNANKEENKGEEPQNINYSVTYKYFLDDEEVANEIKQQIIEINVEELENEKETVEVYSFKEYRCTNNVEGTWNNESWSFTPNLTADTTCRLYFIKNLHNVSFTTINGILPNKAKEQMKTIKKDEETIINVLPIEGYKYSSVNCTNNVVTEYNEETNDLTIKKATKDSSCTVSFEINAYKAEIKVSNGTVNEDTKTANYGEDIEFEITPSENYGNPTIICTNEQNLSYENGKLVISAITKDTQCTVQYKPIKFNVSLKVNNGTLISTTPSPQSVTNGRTVSFGISANEGYKITGAETQCDKENTSIEVGQGGIVKIHDVTSDLSCEVTLKADE